MFGEAQPPRSSARSPELDIDSLSVRSDDSGESSWTDMGDSISVATEGDASIGEGLFRVERDDDSRLGGVSPCLEVAEEVMGEGSLPDNEPAERLVSVLTIHLGRLAAAQVSGSGTSSLLLTADSVGFTEADVQDYAHFQFRCVWYFLCAKFCNFYPGLASRARHGRKRHLEKYQRPPLHFGWTPNLQANHQKP